MSTPTQFASCNLPPPFLLCDQCKGMDDDRILNWHVTCELLNGPVLILNRFLVFCCALALSVCSNLAETNILFLGNSFTHGGLATTSVPRIFDGLAHAGLQGDVKVTMDAPGGVDFGYHLSRPSIEAEHWTHVVLQNFSSQPTHVGNLAAHFANGRALYNRVIANHPESKVLLYETWSRAVGNGEISGYSSPTTFASTDEMQTELRDNYSALRDRLKTEFPLHTPITIAPVGDAWQNAGGLLAPNATGYVSLFASDLYHGNDNGYYLAAAVFYGTVFGASPEGLSSSAEIRALNLHLTNPEFLEQVAWQTVAGVPEPSTAVMLILGGMFLATRHRKGESEASLLSPAYGKPEGPGSGR